jgi:subfamily B ATP-binding cassette protein MsbA
MTDEFDLTSGKKKPENIWRLLSYVRPYWFSFFISTLFGIVKFMTPVIAVWITGRVVDVLVNMGSGKIPQSSAWMEIHKYVLWGICLAVFSFVPTYLRSLLASRAIQRVIFDLRCDLYAHIQKLQQSFFDANRSGSLTSRVISDVETIQPFLNQGLIQGWMNIVQICVILVIFFSQNWVLALLSLLLLPFHIIVQRMISWRVKDNAKLIRDRLAVLAGTTQEKFANSTIVKAFTREDDELQQFSDDSAILIELGVKNANLNGISQAVVTMLNALGPMLLIVIGTYMIIHGTAHITVGILVSFIMMQSQLFSPFERLNELQLTTANALGSTDRIFSIFDTEPEIADKPGARKVKSFQGDIEFSNIYFTYPNGNRPLFENLSLHIPAHTTLALVGPSGSGKTSITYLINRFYEWQEGTISIDGNDIRDYTITSLRGQIGLVPQDAVLFSGTIEDNILYGRPDATPEEVKEAAHRAFADEFIDKMDDGYLTIIGERGARLSGGQKQRIAIARAFLKNPAIIILDEATSALDSTSEKLVQNALQELMKDRTTIVIAHRLSTVRNVDNIAVIEDGRVAELGNHDELITQNGLYADLCAQQFGLEIDVTDEIIS